MHFDIRRLPITASTNDDAKLAAEAGAAEGLVIWALEQKAGRGRQGRQWESPAGNLYASLLLRPPTARMEWGRYSFVAALAIDDCVRGFFPHSLVELKWPNDVLVGGKKISGILLESGEDFLVVGMGLNVLHSPENPLYPATSLSAEQAAPPPLEDILTNFLKAFSAWYDLMNVEGFAPIRAAWLAHARKGTVRVRLDQGEIQGQFVDLDENGALRLLLADGTEKSVNTGDVFFDI